MLIFSSFQKVKRHIAPIFVRFHYWYDLLLKRECSFLIILVIISQKWLSRIHQLKVLHSTTHHTLVKPIGETPQLRMVNSFSKEKVGISLLNKCA
jgi:hypothetical protein